MNGSPEKHLLNNKELDCLILKICYLANLVVFDQVCVWFYIHRLMSK